MPRIRITRATVAGKVAVAVGDVVDASDKDARYLVAINKAVLGEAEKAEAPVEPDVQEDAEPDAEVEAEKAEAMSGLIATAVPGGKRHRK